MPTAPSILVPGHNHWRRLPAARASVLIDAAPYFAAVAEAFERARRSIIILSWDIDSRTALHGGCPEDATRRLGGLLNTLVRRHRDLHVYVLDWDFAVIYATERELLPLYRRDWRAHRRLHFRFDAEHPLGACHHQKVVVIDDAVAFVGGLDICGHRWDTCAHDPDDQRRVGVGGKPYEPFHDVQMAVDGPAAAALGALARERWWRATGERLAAPRPDGDPWPPSLEPDFTDVEVAIARTDPGGDERPAVREVEHLFVDAIRAARRWLYVENQYLTSTVVADALAARLDEPDGPEMLLVVPRRCSGWLEEQTMGMRRARLVERLRAGDRFGRLRIVAPVIADRDLGTNVHSKVMIVDDELLRIGSANLSNRSMAVDTECDLALEAAGDPRLARAIAAVRDRLLGDHLGVEPARVAAAVAATGSLLAAVDRLAGGTHTLVPLAPPPPGWLDALPDEAHLFDPTDPIAPELLMERLVPPEVQGSLHHPFLRGGANLLALSVAVAAAYGMGLDVVAVTEPARRLAGEPVLVLLLFVGGGLAFVPVTILIVATVLALGPAHGLPLAVAGVLASAIVSYGIGRALGRERMGRLAGRRLNRLTARLSRRGALAVAAARMLALAPFTVMNLVAGAWRVPFRDYALGTLLGTVPGVIAIALGTGGLVSLTRRFAIAGLGVLVAGGVTALLIGLRLGRLERPRLSARGGSLANAADHA